MCDYITRPCSFDNGAPVGRFDGVNSPGVMELYMPYLMQNPIYEYALKKKIDAEYSMARDNNKRCNDEILLEKKEDIAKRRDAAIEERRINRELATYSVYEDGHGELCLELMFPDGSRNHSYSLINQKHIKVIKYRNFDLTEEICVIKWDGNGGICVDFNHDTNGRLKEFERIGLHIRNVGRDRKKMVADLIFGFLLEHASEEMLYPHMGWFLVDNTWKFISDKDMTLEKIKEKGV